MNHKETIARLRQQAEAGQQPSEQEVRRLLKSLQKTRDAMHDDYMRARDAAIPPEVKAKLQKIDEEYQLSLDEVSVMFYQALDLLNEVASARFAES